MAKTVSNISDLISELGGPTRAAEVLGATSPQQVVNWRLRGKITAELFTAHQDILSRLGLAAPASLWGMITVEAAE